jgi:hypothetical protein
MTAFCIVMPRKKTTSTSAEVFQLVFGLCFWDFGHLFHRTLVFYFWDFGQVFQEAFVDPFLVFVVLVCFWDFVHFFRAFANLFLSVFP